MSLGIGECPVCLLGLLQLLIHFLGGIVLEGYGALLPKLVAARFGKPGCLPSTLDLAQNRCSFYTLASAGQSFMNKQFVDMWQRQVFCVQRFSIYMYPGTMDYQWDKYVQHNIEDITIPDLS